MPSDVYTSPLFLAGILFSVLGIVLLLGALVAFVRLRLLTFAFRTLFGLVLLALGAVAGTIAVGIQGYRALMREDIAARIAVKPAGPQRFDAAIRLPDGREATYQLAGDEIFVDAHILKWHPYVNWIGLHTVYELDRLGGRYHDIRD